MLFIVNLLRGTRWQQVQVIPLVPRNPSGQEDGIRRCVVPQELLHILTVLVAEGVGGDSSSVTMHSTSQTEGQVVLLQGLETGLP